MSFTLSSRGCIGLVLLVGVSWVGAIYWSLSQFTTARFLYHWDISEPPVSWALGAGDEPCRWGPNVHFNRRAMAYAYLLDCRGVGTAEGLWEVLERQGEVARRQGLEVEVFPYFLRQSWGRCEQGPGGWYGWESVVILHPTYLKGFYVKGALKCEGEKVVGREREYRVLLARVFMETHFGALLPTGKPQPRPYFPEQGENAPPSLPERGGLERPKKAGVAEEGEWREPQTANFPGVIREGSSEDVVGSLVYVVVRARLDSDGKLLEAFVERSSGDAKADNLCLERVRSGTFRPGIREGRPVAGESSVGCWVELY